MKTLTLTTQLTRDTLEPMFDVARKFSLTFSNFVFDDKDDDIMSYDIHLPESLTREEWHAALREFQLEEVGDFSDKLFGEEECDLCSELVTHCSCQRCQQCEKLSVAEHDTCPKCSGEFY